MNFIDRRTINIYSSSPLSGQTVNIETTYLYTFAHRPDLPTPGGLQLYGPEFVKLSDMLSDQGRFNFIDRRTLNIYSPSPLSGQTVNLETTYVHTLALRPDLPTTGGRQLYGREFVKFSDLLSDQSSFKFIDRRTINIDGPSPLSGQNVNLETTYLYTFALRSDLPNNGGLQLYGPEFVKLSDFLSEINSAS